MPNTLIIVKTAVLGCAVLVLIMLYRLSRRPGGPFRKTLIVLSLFFSSAYILWRIFYTSPYRTPEDNPVFLIFFIILLLMEFLDFLNAVVLKMISWNPYVPPKIPDNDEGTVQSVDVLVLTFHEDIGLLEKTAAACLRLKYAGDFLRIHICDDAARPEVEELSRRLNINYIKRDRPDNAKAGNINNALGQTSGALVLVLDADMIVRQDFLEKTVPYFLRPETGFVQAPQTFYNPDPFQHNLRLDRRVPNEQDLFMRHIEPCRASANAVLHVGTNAVFRRSALEKAGGVPYGSVTEDLALGLLVESLGYEGFTIGTGKDCIKVVSIETNALSNLTGFTVSNAADEPFNTGAIRVDNHGLSYSMAQTGVKENIFNNYSYPSGYDPGLVRISDWDIGLFTYTNGGLTNAASGLFAADIFNSFNHGLTPEEQNGSFTVLADNPSQFVYRTFEQGMPSTNGDIFTNVWDGVNENTGMVMPDGVYYSKVYSFDAASNQSARTIPFEIDNTPPSLAVTYPVTDQTVGGMIDITGSIIDKRLAYYTAVISNNGVGYDVSSGTGVVSNGVIGSFDTLGLVNNIESRLYITAVDGVSNSASICVPFIITNSEDVVFRIVKVENSVLNSKGRLRITYYYKDVTVSIQDAGMPVFQTNYTTEGTDVFEFTPAGKTDGNYTLAFQALVNIPGRNPVVRNVSYEVDNTPPALAMTGLSGGGILRGVIGFDGSVIDKNLLSYSLILSNSTGDEESVIVSEGMTGISSGRIGVFDSAGINANSPFDGTNQYAVILRAYDSAGNTNEIVKTIYIDNAEPFADLTAGRKYRLSGLNGPAALTLTAQDVHLAGASLYTMDSGGIYHKTVDWSGIVSGVNTVTWNCSSLSGTVPAALYTYDLAGNTNTRTYTFTIDNKVPEIRNLTASQAMTRLILSADLWDNDLLARYEVGVQSGPEYRVYASEDMETNERSISVDEAFADFEASAATVFVKVWDFAGNETVTNFDITADSLPPVAGIETPSDNTVSGGVMHFKGTLLDNNMARAELLLDGTVIYSVLCGAFSNTIEYDLDTKGLPDGTHSLTLRGYDYAGNVGAAFVRFTSDNTPPLISLRALRNGSDASIGASAGALDFYLNYSDANPASYKLTFINGGIQETALEGTVESIYSGRFIGTLDTAVRNLNGIYQFMIEGVDLAGNRSTNYLTLDIDNSAPVLAWNSLDSGRAFDSPGFLPKVRGIVSAGFTLTDAHSVNYTASCGALTSTGTVNSGAVVWPLDTALMGEGLQSLEITAVDATGNRSSWTTNFIVDRTAPALSLTAGPEIYSPLVPDNKLNINVTANETVKLQSVEIDDETGLKGKLDITGVIPAGSSLFAWDGRTAGAALPDGNYRIKVTASDEAGNTSEACSGTIFYRNDNRPPLVTVLETNNVFSPALRPFRIRYEALNDSTDLSNIVISTLTVSSAGMDVFRIVATNQEGVIGLEWNGLNSTGRAPDGNYDAILNVADAAGNAVQVRFVITVDSVPPVLEQLTLSRVKISKNNPLKNQSEIHLAVSDKNLIESMMYSIDRYDMNILETTNEVGLSNYILDSVFKEEDNALYTISFSFIDSASNESKFTTNIEVDNNPPDFGLDMKGNYFTTNDGSELKIFVNTNVTVRPVIESADTAAMYWGLVPEGTAPVLAECTTNDVMKLEGKADGRYMFTRAAVDDVGNGLTNSLIFTVDGTSPFVSLNYPSNQIGIGLLTNGGKKYLSFSNEIIVQGSDSGSGLAGLWIRVENLSNGYFDEIPLEDPSNSLSFDSLGINEPGDYLITAVAFDHVTNIGVTWDYVSLPLPDRTPPVSALAISGSYNVINGDVYASSNTTFIITAADNPGLNDGCASGVNRTEISINGGDWQTYSVPVIFTMSGTYVMEYRSVDNAGNIEEAKTVRVIVQNSVTAVSGLRSLVLDRTNIIYQWNITNNIAPENFELTALGTNFTTTNSYFILTNIALALTNMPLFVEAKVRAVNQAGLYSAYLIMTNILDTIIDIRQPSMGGTNYFKEAIPVYSEFQNEDRSIKTLDYYGYLSNDALMVPTNWTLVSEDENYNNDNKLSEYIWKQEGNNQYPVLGDGKYAVRVGYSDVKGNIRTDARFVNVDNTPPAAECLVDGIKPASNFVQAVNSCIFSINASDPVSNGVSSGVRRIWYAVDQQSYNKQIVNFQPDKDFISRCISNNGSGDDYQVYTGPIKLTKGVYTIAYFGEDWAQKADIIDDIENNGMNKNEENWEGNLSEAQFITIEVREDSTVPVDVTPPVITISGVSNSAYYNKPVNITVSASDAALSGIKVILDGNEQTHNAFTVSGEGSHILKASAWDMSGNTNSMELSFVIDTVSPLITVNGLSNTNLIVPAQISYTVSDENLDSYSARLNGTLLTTNSFVVSNAGSYTLSITALDRAGNVSIYAGTFTASEIDITPPVITVTGVGEGRYTNINLYLTITVEDKNLLTNKTEILADGKYYAITNGKAYVSFKSEGSHVLSIYAEDKYHNVSAYYKEIIIDRKAPLIEVLNVFDQHSYLRVKPLVRITDDSGSIVNSDEYLVKNGNVTNIYTNSMITNTGSYSLFIMAIDEAGNAAYTNIRFNIVKDPDSTILLYAGFEYRDSATVFYGTGGNTIANMTNRPQYIDGYYGQGIIAHKKDSPGVSYSMKSNVIWNPVKGAVEFAFKKFWYEYFYCHYEKMTLFEVKDDSSPVFSIYVDRTYRIIVSAGGTNCVLDENRDNEGDEHEHDWDRWSKVKVVYDLNPADGKPVIKLYIGDILKGKWFITAPVINAAGKNYRINFGFGEGEKCYTDEHMHLDELKIFEDFIDLKD